MTKTLKLKTVAFCVVGALLAAGLSGSAMAQTDSPVQSSARPFGLEIVDTVKLAGSDARSTDFQSNTLPALQSIVNDNLGERGGISDISSMALDPSKLSLTTAADVRVYFVGEGAGYKNTLGFNTQGGGIDSGNPQLIFPDASSMIDSSSQSTPSNPVRNPNTPLLAGDFVDLGTLDAGQQLDFFLIANGAKGGTNTYSTDSSINPDGLDHVVAFALNDSPYLLIGFEDMWGGGDLDYNDLLFAVDIGEANVGNLPGVPEPAMWYSLLSLLAIGLFLQFRRRHAKP